jgi:hypothetical protein
MQAEEAVRFAAWDSAGNGAFWQPVHLRRNNMPWGE